jgi:hypothetical protein
MSANVLSRRPAGEDADDDGVERRNRLGQVRSERGTRTTAASSLTSATPRGARDGERVRGGSGDRC